MLGDLSPGGAMMVGSRQDLLAEQCPLSVQSDLRHLYSSVCELIRHFWDAFPPTKYVIIIFNSCNIFFSHEALSWQRRLKRCMRHYRNSKQ